MNGSDFDAAKLDDFYRMNVRVVDADGKLLDQGRDLDALIRRFRGQTAEQVSAIPDDSPAREGLTRWDFEDLPSQWRFQQAGVDIVSYPALVDDGDRVSIQLFDYPGKPGSHIGGGWCAWRCLGLHRPFVT